MTSEKQMDEWVKGNPIHNKERDECCPDFSCCTGKIAPREVRVRFAKAVHDGDENTKIQMLIMFLGNAFADKNIYIAGDDAAHNKVH